MCAQSLESYIDREHGGFFLNPNAMGKSRNWDNLLAAAIAIRLCRRSAPTGVIYKPRGSRRWRGLIKIHDRGVLVSDLTNQYFSITILAISKENFSNKLAKKLFSTNTGKMEFEFFYKKFKLNFPSFGLMIFWSGFLEKFALNNKYAKL